MTNKEDLPPFGRTIPGPANTKSPPGFQWDNPPKEGRRGKKTRKEAIHAHCYECNGVQAIHEQNDCVDDDCDLYPYRPGGGHGTVKTQTGRKPPRKATGTASKEEL